MKNFIQVGDILDAIAPAGGVIGGNAYLLNKAFGVAAETAIEGAAFAYVVEGVVELPIPTGALAQFATVYWDDTGKTLTSTVGSNQKVGYLSEIKPAGQLTGRVKLIPVV